MLTLNNTIGKTCLIGLTYFSAKGELLKQSLLAGKVSGVDVEKGIGVTLFEQDLTRAEDSATSVKAMNSGRATKSNEKEFILPTDLTCWFNAPKGAFHTSVKGVVINDPDYLVTWDIHQSKAVENSEQMHWWQWKPRTQAPQVMSNDV